MIHAHSRQVREAASLLGLMIRNARIERGMTVTETAERAGVSRGLVGRVERGDPACALGTVLELAVIVGLSLFADDQEAERDRLAERLSVERERRALLPKTARRSRVSASGGDGGKGVVDDF